MSFTVDGQSFGSIPVVPNPDKSPALPIVSDDTIESYDYCPYCELFLGIRVRSSGNPYGEGRTVIVNGIKQYTVCHLHAGRYTTGKVKELPTKASA